MTADDARELAKDSAPQLETKVKIVLEQWHYLIRKAASAVPSRKSVRESQLAKVRTPIPYEAYAEARRMLQDAGFQVRRIRTCDDEYDYEVSW